MIAVVHVTDLDRYAAVRTLNRAVAGRGGLVGEYRGGVVLVLAAEEAVPVGEQVQAAIAAAGGSATVGVATADGDLAHGYAEARRCLDTLLTLGRTGEVSDPAGLGLARLLLGENGPAQLGDFLTATLGPVLAYDAQRGTGLVDTLEAWFATGGSAREAAVRLHVHPNTVAQRLARVGELLGPDWRDPGRSLDLHLALRLHRLRSA